MKQAPRTSSKAAAKSPLRHRSEGGYARGDETRARIIAAAIKIFGERSYEGASTRDIAKLAGVNAPALQYYFDSKEGVYRACVEYIADSAWTLFRPTVEAAEATLAGNPGRSQLLEAFHRLQDAIADHLLASQDAEDGRLFMAHEQAGHGPSMLFDIMDKHVRTRMKKVMAQLIERLTGRAADDPITLLRMLTLHGQLMVFHSARKSVLMSMGWQRIEAAELVVIKQTVREATQTLIEAWAKKEGSRKK